MRARLALLIVAALPGFAQSAPQPDKKAIVIGINCYWPEDPNPSNAACAGLKDVPADKSATRYGTLESGSWGYWHYENLGGAVNDAVMMKKILESQGFTIKDDAYLLDGKATASAILKALRTYLIDDVNNAKPGDVRFVYYSGHGNYVINLASTDPRERYDETMVPSDHWRGTSDIRDKELSRIFTEASKKNPNLKIIFVADSCHSGSLSRGPQGVVKTASSGSAEDEKAPRIRDAAPADGSKKNLILFSAARRDQPAKERPPGNISKDRQDFQSSMDEELRDHGAFTWALRKAWLGQPQASMDQLIRKASALLALDNAVQVPNLEGPDTGLLNLFGEPVDASKERIAVAEQVSGDDIQLRGGRTSGIYENTELKRVAANRPAVEVRVMKQKDTADVSPAHVIEHGPGNYAVRVGDTFQVDKLVIPQEAMISVYIPPAMGANALQDAVRNLSGLDAKLGKNWVPDEAGATPTHVLRWNGKTWLLEQGDFEEGGTDLGPTPTADAVAAKLPKDAKLFVALPPSGELVKLLPFGKEDKGRVIVTTTPAAANYRLRGRISEGAAEYSWMRPSVNSPAAKEAAKKNELRLPLGTEWVKTDATPVLTAENLSDKAYKLGRLREWQSMIGYGSSLNPFPYKLEVREVGQGKPVIDHRVFGGKKYKLYLTATAAQLSGNKALPRYVYIFAIDQYGKGTLLWPVLGQGNQDNLFPAPVASGETQPPRPTEIPVSGNAEYDFEVGEPYGNDTYLFLSTESRIDNPDIFEFDGVRTTPPQSRGGGFNPLEELLQGIGTTRSRGVTPPVPTAWNLESFILHSEAAPAK